MDDDEEEEKGEYVQVDSARPFQGTHGRHDKISTDGTR